MQISAPDCYCHKRLQGGQKTGLTWVISF